MIGVFKDGIKFLKIGYVEEGVVEFYEREFGDSIINVSILGLCLVLLLFIRYIINF